MAKKPMSENSRKVLQFLKDNYGTKFTCKDVMTALGFEKAGSVTGSVTGLAKKGLVDKSTETVEVDGKQKEVKYFQLNEAGLNYDPDAQVEE
jgi:predicted transcriptional regulator